MFRVSCLGFGVLGLFHRVGYWDFDGADFSDCDVDGEGVGAGGGGGNGGVEGEFLVEGEGDRGLVCDFVRLAWVSGGRDEGDVGRVNGLSVQVEALAGDDGAGGEDVGEVEGEAVFVGP